MKRTTALRMREGGSGWDGTDISTDDATDLDLVWWTWAGKLMRPHGHVGVFITDNSTGLLGVTHASEKRGVVLDRCRGSLYDDISATRRLKILE